jgi:hypothetical protein
MVKAQLRQPIIEIVDHGLLAAKKMCTTCHVDPVPISPKNLHLSSTPVAGRQPPCPARLGDCRRLLHVLDRVHQHESIGVIRQCGFVPLSYPPLAVDWPLV